LDLYYFFCVHFFSYYYNYLKLLPHTYPLLQAHCKLKPHVFQVTSTTSQIKYNHKTFLDIKFLSSSFKSIHQPVAFASLQLLQSCNQNSIFSSLFISFSKNLFIFFVELFLSIFNSTFILSRIYFILSCSVSIFLELKYSHRAFQVLKTIGQLIQKCVNNNGQNSE